MTPDLKVISALVLLRSEGYTALEFEFEGADNLSNIDSVVGVKASGRESWKLDYPPPIIKQLVQWAYDFVTDEVNFGGEGCYGDLTVRLDTLEALLEISTRHTTVTRSDVAVNLVSGKTIKEPK